MWALGARAETVLVIPFFNTGQSPNHDWIGEGIAEDIRESLDAAGVLVLDRDTREEAYRRLSIRPTAQLTSATVIKLGETLDAVRVIYGEFRVTSPIGAAQSKGALRVKGQILHLGHMRRERELTAAGSLENMASVFAGVSWQALSAVSNPARLPPEEKFRARRKPVRLDALENYIRGLLATQNDQKHRYFTQAARLEPDFSQPCFELGRLRWKARDFRVAAGWLERVRPGDPRYFRASFLLGLCRFHTGDYEHAESSFQLVAGAVPLSEVWNNLGAAQSRRNRPGALDNFQRALDGDSNDPVYLFNLGYALWKQEDFDEAAEDFRGVLERNPDDAEAKTMLLRCQKQEGARPAEARVEIMERLKDSYDDLAWRRLKAPGPNGNGAKAPSEKVK